MTTSTLLGAAWFDSTLSPPPTMTPWHSVTYRPYPPTRNSPYPYPAIYSSLPSEALLTSPFSLLFSPRALVNRSTQWRALFGILQKSYFQQTTKHIRTRSNSDWTPTTSSTTQRTNRYFTSRNWPHYRTSFQRLFITLLQFHYSLNRHSQWY